MSVTLHIESTDHEGQGIARNDGKTVFVEGGLTGETVVARITRSKPNYDKATVEQVLRPSPFRVAPDCPHFGVCGGCSMQHLDARAQVAAKQRVLEDNFKHIGNVQAEQMLPPIEGPHWGYRHRARLSVRHVVKKGGVLVGFHEKRSSYVADMRECRVLPPAVSDLLVPLRALIASLAIRDRAPQIEYAQGDGLPMLVLRHLEPVGDADLALLRAFAAEHQVQWYLQPKGPETAHPLPGEAHTLGYALTEFGLRYRFQPTEFTQVNPHINAMLVRRAMRLLELRPDDRVGDLFCGLGNFTLPIAQRAAFTYGIEGSAPLIARARENAAENGLADRVDFAVANLFEIADDWFDTLPQLNKLLIDPPRDGAMAVVKALPPAASGRLERLVYVSCSPSTLARDAAILIHEKGYRLAGAGVANMFPHTAHVESIALFVP
ncbi:MAG TPA: 23S rRNA (uracil(1939)-C(5))-methyltransferase RlmD [Casimicrobium huifangae]|nr:23S rRNA (uracil(1939)-C(5))-methyltransferase RlmD [Casimicrobium huifangae]HQD64938.1 23S rRNA (uracil(1939)-C(5))-methyltransferase RlmD [Casimicrobium huifangae]